MRSTQQMMTLILDFAREQAQIRLVGMEGSRVNPRIAPDAFQDFDVTYFVTDMVPFTQSEDWLAAFGSVLMMQKPEDMELFPAEEPGYSYLVLFEDYQKIDFTFLPLEQLPAYLVADRLRTLVLDKDGRVPQPPTPTDADYWIGRPSARSFDDCCNEFWNLATYVVRGLCRDELLYAVDHLQLMRRELLRMLSWQVGLERGFDFSVGKGYKFLPRYLPEPLWQRLLSTYRQDSREGMWRALFTCLDLLRESSRRCAEGLGYPYPVYDARVSAYVTDLYAQHGGAR